MRVTESRLNTGSGELQNEPPVESIQDAERAGLVYVSDSDPGIRRIPRKNGFAYVGADNRPIKAPEELGRIARLAIPPAYTDVWICAHRRGHIQATGRDARGRKQYRYHPDWRSTRDSDKFDRMAQFGKALPKLRRRIRHDLALKGLPRDKVLAVIAALLDSTRVRIGNPEYARENNSFGLTTLRNRHVKFIRDRRAVLRFRGKGGADHEVVVDDARIVKIVRRCQHLPGQMLFQYIDDTGERRAVDSQMVNDYLREAMCGEFTAKDFRTWGATVRAIVLLACTPLPESGGERALNACIVAAVRDVARELRNTPAVCRKSYINPMVFSAWRSGDLHKAVDPALKSSSRTAERVALKFLASKSMKQAAVRTKLRKSASATGANVPIPTKNPARSRHRIGGVAPRVALGRHADERSQRTAAG